MVSPDSYGCLGFKMRMASLLFPLGFPFPYRMGDNNDGESCLCFVLVVGEGGV